MSANLPDIFSRELFSANNNNNDNNSDSFPSSCYCVVCGNPTLKTCNVLLAEVFFFTEVFPSQRRSYRE